MNIADCYRLLGLRTGASHEDIKASYRRLARQLHPDVNPGDQRAKERFIRITEAYRYLLTVVPPTATEEPPTSKTASRTPGSESQNRVESQPPKVRVTRKEATPTPQPSSSESNRDLSLIDQHLKQSCYEQLQQLLRSKRFPRAIALIEALVQRLPNDPDARQWHAIAYRQWGLYMIQTRELDKARLYLKKALRTDPHNRRLWADIEQDFLKLEQAMNSRN